MSEEMKKQETMEDYMNEINASFSNFRDDDMLVWDKLAQMKEDKESFEVNRRRNCKRRRYRLCGRDPGLYPRVTACPSLCRGTGRISEENHYGQSN